MYKMNNLQENKKLVTRFWHDLYTARDYEKCGSYFSANGLYRDIPTSDPGARGPKAISRRLKMGLSVIDNHVHHLHHMVAEENTVVTVHTEDWHFKTGEVISLPFVSVQTIENGKITSWDDYWDTNTLLGKAPKWWLDHIASFTPEDFYGDDKL